MIYLAWFTFYNILGVLTNATDIIPLVSVAGVFAIVDHGGVRLTQNKPFFSHFSRRIHAICSDVTSGCIYDKGTHGCNNSKQ